MTTSRNGASQLSIDGAAKETIAPTFGLTVRALRLGRGLTLDRLADETGLSKSHLSRFERGEKTLSIAALIRVSGALATSVASLLGHTAERAAYHLVRRDERQARSVANADGTYSYSSLGLDAGTAPLSAFVIDLPPNASRTGEVAHAGEEVFLVLAGRIEVELEDERLVLDEGDYLQFSGALRHRISSVGGVGRVFIVVAGR